MSQTSLLHSTRLSRMFDALNQLWQKTRGVSQESRAQMWEEVYPFRLMATVPNKRMMHVKGLSSPCWRRRDPSSLCWDSLCA